LSATATLPFTNEEGHHGGINILTVRQLGKNKFFAVAAALAALENVG
jgi:hypothetical protein